MLMGTAEDKVLQGPAEKVVFLEDLTPEERAKVLKEKTGEVLPAGLTNLGNTCYMNSTVQCLRKVTELKAALDTYSGNQHNQEVTEMFMSASRGLFNELEQKGESFTPFEFVQVLRMQFPQFNETDERGHHK